MISLTQFDKEQIVRVANKTHGTALSLESFESAVYDGQTTWQILAADLDRPCACGCGRLVLGGMMEAAHPEDYRDERG